MKKIIIIPAYNEEENIEKTVTAIKQNAKGFDYVIINDCSIDRTREICEKNVFFTLHPLWEASFSASGSRRCGPPLSPPRSLDRKGTGSSGSGSTGKP